MFKALLVGDVHLADRPPASCTDTYLEDLFDLLEKSIKVGQENEVNALVIAGDLFHHKQPGRTSHSTVQRTIELFRSAPFPVLIVPGNHDMFGSRLESVWETQPLGTLFRAGVQVLDGAHEEFPLFGIPWFPDWNAPAPLSRFADWRDKADAGWLLVTHAPLFPLGREIPGELVETDFWVEQMGGNGSCFYGHIHDDHGVWEHNNVTLCNRGALTRGAFTESDINRKPTVTLWEPEVGFIPIVLEHRPASEVFRMQDKKDQAENKAQLDGFLEAVGSARLENSTIEGIMYHVEMMELPRDVIDLIRALLDEVA